MARDRRELDSRSDRRRRSCILWQLHSFSRASCSLVSSARYRVVRRLRSYSRHLHTAECRPRGFRRGHGGRHFNSRGNSRPREFYDGPRSLVALVDELALRYGSRNLDTKDGGTPTEVAYCYDGSDRLTSTSVTGAPSGASPVAGGDLTAAGSSPSLAYDEHGNTTVLADQVLTYDGADRHSTTTLADGTVITYTRDASGRIVQRASTPAATTAVPNPAGLPAVGVGVHKIATGIARMGRGLGKMSEASQTPVVTRSPLQYAGDLVVGVLPCGDLINFLEGMP